MWSILFIISLALDQRVVVSFGFVFAVVALSKSHIELGAFHVVVSGCILKVSESQYTRFHQGSS